MSLIKRAAAVQATFDAFSYKKFRYGQFDCANLAAFCIRQFGHPNPLKGVRKYNSRLGALRAMHQLGIKDFAERLDEFLPRIDPADALPGDILKIPAEDNILGALAIRLSGNDLLAYADIGDTVRAAIMPWHIATEAWSVL